MTTFNQLLTDVGAWLPRADIATHIPTFVRLAEARFNRLLRTPFQEESRHTNATTEYIGLPVNFLAHRNMNRTSDGAWMEYIPPDRFDRFVATAPVLDVPVYTIEDMQFRIYPAPSVASPLPVKILYYARIPALGVETLQNWLCRDHYDVYLFGTLVEARAFCTSEQYELWERRLMVALEQLRSQRNEQMTAKELAVSSEFPITCNGMPL